MLTIQCGVPQGSTLGPLLFLLYLNPIPNCLKKSNIRTFADDTTLFYSSNPSQGLKKLYYKNSSIFLVISSANKLTVNSKKTYYEIMVISSAHEAIKNQKTFLLKSQ